MAAVVETLNTLRPITADDLVAAQELSNEQTWAHRVEDWELMYSLGRGYVVESDGQVVASAMTWPFGDHAARIGMVIVSSRAQSQGHGRRLMETLLAELGERTVMLSATDAGLDLQRKLGFVEAGAVLQHQGAAYSVPMVDLIPDERVRPMGIKDLPVIRSLASRATGMDRGALMDRLVASAQGVVLTRDNEPVGFALFRRFGFGYVVGPTIAPDAGGAKALISHWLGVSSGKFCRIDVPEETGLSDWLEGLGLPHVNTVTTMVRGPALVTDPDARVFSLTTQALG